MTIDELTEADRTLLVEAFRAADQGPFFPEREFHTLMGFDRSDLRKLIEEWPRPSDGAMLDRAANNVLNWLLTYPHGEWEAWRNYSDRSPRDLADLLTKWRGDESFDPSSRGAFDRMM